MVADIEHPLLFKISGSNPAFKTSPKMKTTKINEVKNCIHFLKSNTESYLLK